MKALGILRYPDPLGRIVVPAEIRKEHGWTPVTPVEIIATNDGILLRKYGAFEKKMEIIESLYDLIDQAKDSSIDKELRKVLEYVKER